MFTMMNDNIGMIEFMHKNLQEHITDAQWSAVRYAESSI